MNLTVWREQYQESAGLKANACSVFLMMIVMKTKNVIKRDIAILKYTVCQAA